jgi:uncharacterized protein YndB with AHSA1/START domain
MSAGASLSIVRRFSASPAQVWAACTQPELLRHWLSPKPFRDCMVEADARVGGRFFFRMTGEPGTFAADGIYRDVDEPRRLSLTWTWTEGPPGEHPDGNTSLVTFDIKPDGDGTRLMLTHTGLPNQAEADSHEEGWTETFEKLAALLEGETRS